MFVVVDVYKRVNLKDGESMNQIIDNVHELMKLSRDELDEVLLDEKYNKAMLRELVRRSINTAQDYKLMYEMEATDGRNVINIDKRTFRLLKDVQIAIDRFNMID
jgi:hypothetical protein